MPNNRSIIKNEKTNYKTNLILQTINTPSANVATIANNPTSLKMENRLELHDSCCKPDKIESIPPPLTSVVNIISVPLKIWRQKQKITTNQWFVLMLMTTYTSSKTTEKH